MHLLVDWKSYAHGQLGALLIFASLLCACGPSVDERLARGQQSYTEGDYRAASVDARSVLQESPDNLQGRLLLGRTALALGNIPSAEKEFDRALSLGADPSEIANALGRVWLAKGEYDRVLNDLPELSNASPDQLRTSSFLRAQAFQGLKQFNTARSTYQQILAADSDDAEAMLGIVTTYLLEGEHQQAWATLEQVRQLKPDNVAAVLQAAVLSAMSGSIETARDDYERALELAIAQSDQASHLAALKGLVEVNLQDNDVAAAKEQLNALIALAPNDLQTQFYRGRLAFLQDDLDGAQQHLQGVLRVAPDLPPARLLLGAVHLRRGNLGQAELYLAALVGDGTDNIMARRLLAETKLRQKQLDAADLALQPLLRNATADPDALALAAQISVASGDFGGAIEYLRQRADQEPDNASLHMDLAGAYLASGDFVTASSVMRAISPTDGEEGYRLGLMRIMATARSGDFATALAMLERLQKKWPNDARLLNILGAINLTIGNSTAAIGALQSSLQVKPDNPATLMLLGRAEAALGLFSEARSRFEAVLPIVENRAPALRALALIAASESDADAAIDLLKQASSADPTDVSSRILLARQLLLKQDFKAAYDAASGAVVIAADNAEAFQVLGESQEQLNDLAGARDSFERASTLDPGEERHLLSHARVLQAIGRASDARQVLDQFAERAVGDLEAMLRLALFEADSGNPEVALALVARAVKQHPDSALPLVVRGELMYRAGDVAAGAQSFDAALDRNLNARIASRAYQLRVEHGGGDASLPLTRYLAANPSNAAMRLVLAQYQQSSGQRDAALQSYDAVISNDPDNFVALNNLAWIMNENGDERAAEIAKRAYQLVPDNPSVVDTYGWILVSSGRTDEGVEILRRAVEISGGKPQIRYHLAAALSMRGDHAEARLILEGLVKSETEFSSRNEAEALLTKLQSNLLGS